MVCPNSQFHSLWAISMKLPISPLPATGSRGTFPARLNRSVRFGARAWSASRSETESALADSWQLGAPTRDALRVVETLCRKFPAFARILLKRHGQRTAIEIVDEYDVQYLIHALLVLHFDYVVAEEHTPIRGGNPARMDFLLKNERIVVETKMTRKNLG